MLLAFLTPLAKMLAAVINGYIQEWQKRRDLTLLERQRVAIQGAENEIKALRHSRDPNDPYYVVPDAPSVPLPTDHPKDPGQS